MPLTKHILKCIPTREEFAVYDITPTTFKSTDTPLDLNITTRFQLDGQDIKIDRQTVNSKMGVREFIYRTKW